MLNMVHSGLVMLLTVITVYTSSYSQDSEWKLQKDENGVRIYTRHAEGFDIDELRSETTVKASLSAVIGLIMDANNFNQWIYACPESRILNKISETEQYQYQVNDLPYPFTDRDIVIHFKIRQDPETGIVYSSNIAEPDYLPKEEDKVRVPVFLGGYELSAGENGTVNVSYQIRINPGGNIPDWLVNWFIVKAPYESTLKLKERVESGLYNDAKFRFLTEGGEKSE